MSPASALSLNASAIGSTTFGIAALFFKKSGRPSPGPFITGILGSLNGRLFTALFSLFEIALSKFDEIEDIKVRPDAD